MTMIDYDYDDLLDGKVTSTTLLIQGNTTPIGECKIYMKVS